MQFYTASGNLLNCRVPDVSAAATGIVVELTGDECPARATIDRINGTMTMHIPQSSTESGYAAAIVVEDAAGTVLTLKRWRFRTIDMVFGPGGYGCGGGMPGRGGVPGGGGGRACICPFANGETSSTVPRVSP
mgnify:CR=1 FL=1